MITSLNPGISYQASMMFAIRIRLLGIVESEYSVEIGSTTVPHLS